MQTEKEIATISKFLSLVLRHKPETIGISLDANGWAAVENLIDKSNAYGLAIDFEKLRHVVDTNAKKRFAFSDDFTKIRASQGHSINIDLGYLPQNPPEVLYHGTAEKNRDSILKHGLQKRSRDHVHLSRDIETAIVVGKRHGKPIVIEVLSGKMAGHDFYLSANGVWLTDHVPVEFLREMP